MTAQQPSRGAELLRDATTSNKYRGSAGGKTLLSLRIEVVAVLLWEAEVSKCVLLCVQSSDRGTDSVADSVAQLPGQEARRW